MTEQWITSRQNPAVQLAVRLQASRAERKKTGLFAADGTKLLEEAVRWASLHTVFLCENVQAPVLPADVRVYRIPEGLMRAVSKMETPQGALFLCRIPAQRPLQIRPGTLILDGVQDPGNVGTILRTANALEIPVVLTEGCADVYNPKTVRAAMGAVFRDPPVASTCEAVLAQLQSRGIPLAATALSPRAKDLRTLRLAQMALVIGSEGRGVSRRYLDAADELAIIPMNPDCESLNAAIAAAIVMWQMKQF